MRHSQHKAPTLGSLEHMVAAVGRKADGALTGLTASLRDSVALPILMAVEKRNFPDAAKSVVLKLCKDVRQVSGESQLRWTDEVESGSTRPSTFRAFSTTLPDGTEVRIGRLAHLLDGRSYSLLINNPTNGTALAYDRSATAELLYKRLAQKPAV